MNLYRNIIKQVFKLPKIVTAFLKQNLCFNYRELQNLGWQFCLGLGNVSLPRNVSENKSCLMVSFDSLNSPDVILDLANNYELFPLKKKGRHSNSASEVICPPRDQELLNWRFYGRRDSLSAEVWGQASRLGALCKGVHLPTSVLSPKGPPLTSGAGNAPLQLMWWFCTQKRLRLSAERMVIAALGSHIPPFHP